MGRYLLVNNRSKREKLIYFAGLFDGEGSCGIYKDGKGGNKPEFSISMTDKDVLQDFCEVWPNLGLKLYEAHRYQNNNTNRKTMYTVSSSHVKCLIVLEDLYPFLRIKKKNAEKVFERYDELYEKVPSRKKRYYELRGLSQIADEQNLWDDIYA